MSPAIRIIKLSFEGRVERQSNCNEEPIIKKRKGGPTQSRPEPN
ncbi:MAG: hypothetical protein JWQ71_2566 [Pedosphaera sp.]|nr:hypothetical protein [Pedosphaera sp.]